MNILKLPVWALLILTLTGCAIQQTVNPVTDIQSKEVCIIENPPVRPGFLATYRNTLQEQGFQVKLLPVGSNYDKCPVVSTYTGKWSWDLGLYLAYAEIKVYKHGVLTGNALYDSTKGSANFSKFIKGEEKIRELVIKLFPGTQKT